MDQSGKSVVRYVAAALVALITILVYLPVLQNDFVDWDDDQYVYENPMISSLNWNFFKFSMGFYANNWHPVTWISHAIDYAVWGLNPVGHHLTSVVLHGVNTFLVVVLVGKLLGAVREEGSGTEGVLREKGRVIGAAVTGLLFGLHPLHVESVAWVSERKDVLCALFFLLSVLVYIRYIGGGREKAEDAGGAKRYYLYSVVLFVLALMSKPMAVTLPVVLLMLDWYPFGRFRDAGATKRVFLEKVPFFALSLVSAILTILAQRSAGSIAALTDAPLITRTLLGVKALILYLEKMILPQTLSPFYPYPLHVSFFSYPYLLSAMAVFTITMVTVALARRDRIWVATWAYYVITLLPVLGIIQVGRQAMADRYTYLPSLGPFLLAGVGSAWFAEKMNVLRSGKSAEGIVSVALCVLLTGILSVMTVKQIGIWKNGIVLWTAAAKGLSQDGKTAYAHSDVIYRNRALAYEKSGRFEEAMKDLTEAIKLNPESTAYHNRGSVFEKAGRFEEALRDYTQAIQLNPDAPGSYSNRGFLYSRLGHAEQALSDYTRAIYLKPDSPELYYNRGNIYARTGRPEDAIRDYTRAIRAGSGHLADYYYNRGIVYKRIGRDDEAMKDLLYAEQLRKAEQ